MNSYGPNKFSNIPPSPVISDPMVAKECSAIELAFRNAESAAEQLMKSVSVLNGKINPILRAPTNDELKPRDPSKSTVPLADRLETLADTIHSQVVHLGDLAERVEL